MFSFVGRGHVFQALGILDGCSDQDVAAATSDVVEDDESGASDPGHMDCPANCHHCACGQIPLVAPALIACPTLVLQWRDIVEAPPPDEAVDQRPPGRVDRPPRA